MDSLKWFGSLFQAMSLFSLFHQWCHLFLPYQKLSDYRSLLDFFTELKCQKVGPAHRTVSLFNLLYLVYILLNVYLWAFLPPPLSRLRQSDVVSVFIRTDSFYLPVIALISVALYIVDVLCFTMKPPFLRLLKDTLFEDRNGTLEGVGYGSKSGQATARYIFLSLANLLQIIVLVVNGVILGVTFKLFSTAIESPGELFGSPLQTPITFIWNVGWILINYVIFVTVAAVYSQIIIYVTVLSAGLLLILFRHLYHSETILAVYKRKDSIFSWAPFRQYLVYSGQTFRILFTANDICGRIFFAFLLVNMPISAWLLVHLSLGDHPGSKVFSLGAMFVHDILVCILLHLAIANFTKRLHAPSKVLLSLNAARGGRVVNLRTRLLLHHTIVRLHTEAKYGITYGSVGGLITMGTFAKCMILYSELLMYSYKLICHI